MKKMKQCLIEEDKLKNSALGNGGNFHIIYFQFERQKTKAHFITEIYIPSTVLTLLREPQPSVVGTYEH